MLITNKTTVKDVEKHPFIGIVDMPIFKHFEMNEVSVYNPHSFEKERKLVLNSRVMDIKSFGGEYKDLVSKTQSNGNMIYFLPTIDGKIVHKNSFGEYIRMAQVKLTKYDFNQKVRELNRKPFVSNVIKTTKNNYMYLLIK